MSDLLVIAYYYPPSGGAGVQRTLKFTKFLPGFGWNPLVLTVKPEYTRLTDLTLQNEIPANITVKCTSALLIPSFLPWRLRHLISRWILMVDEQLGWYPFAVHAGKHLIEKNNFDAIYSTSAPYTDHLIGYALKRFSNLPWIVDMRDPWVENTQHSYPTPLHRQLTQNLERQIIQSADRLVVVSEPMRTTWLERYPWLDPGKVTVITNGYDTEDFTGLPPVDYPTGSMTIIYNGSFYSQGLTPLPFLQALRTVIDQGSIPAAGVKLYLVGNIGRPAQQMVTDLNLQDIVDITGYLPHRQSLSYIISADLLLLVIGSTPGSQVILTGKIFEYLAAQKPILALAPPGAAADLVLEANAGWVVPPDDIPAIADRLVLVYDLWRQERLKIDARPAVIKRYERRALTGRLARLMDDCLPQKDG